MPVPGSLLVAGSCHQKGIFMLPKQGAFLPFPPVFSANQAGDFHAHRLQTCKAHLGSYMHKGIYRLNGCLQAFFWLIEAFQAKPRLRLPGLMHAVCITPFMAGMSIAKQEGMQQYRAGQGLGFGLDWVSQLSEGIEPS
eukprot:1146309-Pelagomonas_calceolata.AAC.7